MSRMRTALFAVAMGAVGVMAVNGIAVAATGQALILGHNNSESTTTVLSRTTSGVPLGIVAKAGSAPLGVNSSVVVTHLNADLVDGRNGTDLQTRPIRYVIPPMATSTSRSLVVLDGVPHGIYSAGFNILANTSPSGTQVSCYLSTDKDTGTGDSQLLAYGSTRNSFSTTNSSGVIDFRTGIGLALTCFSDTGSFNYDSLTTFRAVVTLVRVDALTIHTAAVPAAVQKARTGASSTGR